MLQTDKIYTDGLFANAAKTDKQKEFIIARCAINVKDFTSWLKKNESFVDEIVEDMGSHYKNLEVSDKSIVTIDTYPSVTFQLKGKIDRTGITIPFISRWWVVLYEDKFVLLQTFIIDNAEARVFDKLFSLITNSVIFPDQYN